MTRPAASPALSGSVPHALLRLGFPILVMHALRLAYQYVDAWWVRGLGVEATAAVTSSVFVLWAVLAANDIVSIGVTSYVSQLLGAGDRARAADLVRRALLATTAIGVAITAVGAPLAPQVARLLDPGGSVAEASATYLRILFLGAVFPLLISTSENVMRAAGDTRTSLAIDGSAVLLNVVLDPLLIYGHGPFPRLGLAGAAWATVIAQATGAAAYLVLAWRRHPAFPYGRAGGGPRVSLRALARVGAPVAAIGVLFSAVYVTFVRAASAEGAAGVAVVGIANRIEALQFIVGTALGWAGGALLGHSLGAGDEARAMRVLRTAQRWMVAFSAALMVACLAVPEALLRAFTADPEALRLGVPYLRILALSAIPTGLEIATEGTLTGSGHTRVLSVIYNSVSVLRIVLALAVPAWTGTGVLGLAWILTLTCIVRAAMILAWGERGTWKRGLRRELGIDHTPA